ncbi:B12-binding domain-containing radical SAM protein [Verrucomicrobiota bacterium]
MNVLLVVPPLEKTILDRSMSAIEEDRGVNPPLGLLYVASYLETNSSHEITIIDCQVEGLDFGALQARIGEVRPDVLGMTVMTMSLPSVLEAARLAKEAVPETQIVLGGPHVFLYPEETIRLPGVDFLVVGEGEESFRELLDAIGDKQRLRGIPGLVFRDGGEVVQTGTRPLIEDLDSLPHPARHLVPYRDYSSILAKRDPATTLFTSRGCPFKCTFCSRPHLGKRFRYRSAANVVDEMETCVQMGIQEFLVYDDTFTVKRDRVMAICDEITARKLDVGFDVRARVDTVDDEMLGALKRAGCQGVHYGIEAGTEKILKVLNKGISIERAQEVFKLTRKHGIPVLAYFMIGAPTETEEDILATFDVMARLDPDYVHLTVLIPFPGTQIYGRALDGGLYGGDVWREFAAHPDESFELPHWSETFSREQLDSLAVRGYRQFYLRPTYVMRQIGKLRTLAEFKKKLKAGLHVLGMKK